ncbi:MAG TPA: DoxX family protein [Pseudolysinimonas sp.]|jgi:uncharacterized membrane protein|nr:DoxX family protein [Pseudolysinimonas sp.]
MQIALWVVSGVLAAGFIGGGIARAVLPLERLTGMGLGWVADLPRGLVRVISALEILGGIGLIVPVLTGILPILTPLAACGLALIMLGGLVFHARRREWKNVPVTLVLAVLAVFVAVARFAGV